MRRILLVLLLLALTSAPAAHARGLYVAIGDSYTAGALIPNLVGTPVACGRSDHDYPSLTAQALGFTLRDVSCSGAAIGHATSPQSFSDGSANPPQLDAVTPGAELVTIGLSANDTGIISVPGDCATDEDPAPTSVRCRADHQGAGGDVVAARILREEPRMVQLVRAVRRRAPSARIALVGYPAIAPVNGTACYPTVPLSPDDLAYSDEVLQFNNAMLERVAGTTGVEWVDTHRDTIGHDVCAPAEARWFEGFVPNDVGFPIHPNARGEASLAASLMAVLRRPRPAAAALVSPPVLTGLRQESAARATGKPPRFALTLDRAVPVAFTLQRRSSSGTYGEARRFTRALRTGTSRIRLARSVLGRVRGAYRLTATPDGGSALAVRFRLR